MIKTKGGNKAFAFVKKYGCDLVHLDIIHRFIEYRFWSFDSILAEYWEPADHAMAAKFIWDNWGTRSGIDRRQRQDPYPFPDRRKRTERRSGIDRRKVFYIERRRELDFREAFREL